MSHLINYFPWYNSFPPVLNISACLAASLITRHVYIETNYGFLVQIWSSFLTSGQRPCRTKGHPCLIVGRTHLWGSFIVCEHLPPGADCTAGPWGWKSSLPTLNTLHQVIVKSILTSCVPVGASDRECAQGIAERERGNTVLTSVMESCNLILPYPTLSAYQLRLSGWPTSNYQTYQCPSTGWKI